MVKASSFLDSVHYLLYLIESAINKRFSILVFILIATLSLDTMINQVADIIAPQARSFWGIVLFVIIACISIISQFFILQFVKKKSSTVRSKVTTIKWMHRAVTMSQYIMTIIFVFTVLQIGTERILFYGFVSFGNYSHSGNKYRAHGSLYRNFFEVV